MVQVARPKVCSASYNSASREITTSQAAVARVIAFCVVSTAVTAESGEADEASSRCQAHSMPRVSSSDSEIL